jgi:hypothetical protein
MPLHISEAVLAKIEPNNKCLKNKIKNAKSAVIQECWGFSTGSGKPKGVNPPVRGFTLVSKHLLPHTAFGNDCLCSALIRSQSDRYSWIYITAARHTICLLYHLAGANTKQTMEALRSRK